MHKKIARINVWVAWASRSAPASMRGEGLLLSARVSTFSRPFQPLVVRSKSRAAASLRIRHIASAAAGGAGEDDFISKVIRETPSQVEPRFLVGVGSSRSGIRRDLMNLQALELIGSLDG
ncbi:hypothetical protein HPP92_023792 [Vanilla planifolia]|uniref:Uncharacterized protein n=1 Tax=Vanilla planifolia TaxID=51239 RepID=A0A835PME0_VANPL|nr:hypothetical protein HPP92_023792 [Vanilla planifolia]